MLAIMLNVYENSTGTNNCTVIDYQPSVLDSDGWNYQVCNEMVMPIFQNGKTDMFNAELYSPDAYVAQCQATHWLTPQFDWALDAFGGRNPQKDFNKTSNIVFTNGDLDPWRAGGVLTPLAQNDDVYVTVMKGAAHHLDLRAPNAADPADVTAARKHVETLMVEWIREWRTAPKM
jgi:hypothetical protein